MKEVLIILDGIMEDYFDNTSLKKLILGNLDVKYDIDMVDFSLEGKPVDSLNCIMNILGYSSIENDIGDRAFYEGLNQNIYLKDNEYILRCNIVKVKDGILEDFTGGDLTDNIEDILMEIKINNGTLYPGYKYKNLLVMNSQEYDIGCIKFYPPHFNLGKEAKNLLPKNRDIIEIIKNSYDVFNKHNMNGCILWPWGPSKEIELKSFEDKYNKKVGLVSGIDLVCGMGKALGMKVIKPDETNGDYDTNLDNKLKESLNLFAGVDLLVIHINGFDELAHRKDIEGKIQFIKKVKEVFMIPLISEIKKHRDVYIKITCDHRTDSFTGNHEEGLVPMIRIFN